MFLYNHGRKMMKITNKTLIALMAFAWAANTTAMDQPASPKTPRGKRAEKLRRMLNNNPVGRRASAHLFPTNNATNFLIAATRTTSTERRAVLLAKAAQSEQEGSESRVLSILQQFETIDQKNTRIKITIDWLEKKITKEENAPNKNPSPKFLPKLKMSLARKLIIYMGAPLSKKCEPWANIYQFTKPLGKKSPLIQGYRKAFKQNFDPFQKLIKRHATDITHHNIKLRTTKKSDYKPDLESLLALKESYTTLEQDAVRLYMFAQLSINLKKPVQKDCVTQENPILIEQLLKMLPKEGLQPDWNLRAKRISLWKILSKHLSRETEDVTLAHHAPKFATRLKTLTQSLEKLMAPTPSKAEQTQAIASCKELYPKIKHLVANILPLYIAITKRDNAEFASLEYQTHSRDATGSSMAIEMKFWFVNPKSTDEN